MFTICCECIIYTVHAAAHWVSRWRGGRRAAGHHLRHHAKYIEHHQYSVAKTARQVLEVLGLTLLRQWCDSGSTLCFLGDTGILYKVAHTLQHVLPPGTPIRNHHALHHQDARYNLGITTPLLDVLLGRLHPSQRLASGWRLLLLPVPIAGFWAIVGGAPTGC